MILGLGLLLFIKEDGVLKLYTVRELKEKPELCKKRGMETFPLETQKPTDGSDLETVLRLVDEETGFPRQLVDIRGISPARFNLIPNRNDIFTGYAYGRFLGDPYNGFRPKDTDIEFAGWKTPEELVAGFTRIEVRAIVAHFRRHSFSEIAE